MAADKLGVDGVLNVQSDGVSGSAGWVEADEVKDLAQKFTKNTIDNTTRANGGWRSKKGGLKEGDLTFNMPWLPANAIFVLLKNAWLNTTHLGFQVFDGSTNPSGLIADFNVIDFEVTQNLEGVQEVSVTLAITHVDTAPAWQDPT